MPHLGVKTKNRTIAAPFILTQTRLFSRLDAFRHNTYRRRQNWYGLFQLCLQIYYSMFRFTCGCGPPFSRIILCNNAQYAPLYTSVELLPGPVCVLKTQKPVFQPAPVTEGDLQAITAWWRLSPGRLPGAWSSNMTWLPGSPGTSRIAVQRLPSTAAGHYATSVHWPSEHHDKNNDCRLLRHGQNLCSGTTRPVCVGGRRRKKALAA